MNDRVGNQILKEVSRSFYLTLRLLPGPMREAASLGYLIARTSDTLADTDGISVRERLDFLDAYADRVLESGSRPVWPEALLRHVTSGERKLLQRSDAVFDWLERINPGQRELIREVVGIIIGGQRMDLKRFEFADATRPVALPDEAALDDYTWRVAGCVGAFWTKLGFLTLGSGFSTEDPERLLETGIRFGKGLQLVNVLRDLPEDLAMGRCYLPVADPADRESLMLAFGKWHQQAEQWVSQGKDYASVLKSRRLRAATVLPALIADETLALLRRASCEVLEGRLKVPRNRIYRLLLESFLF